MVESGTAIILAGKNQVGKEPKAYKENGAVAIWATIEIIIGVNIKEANFHLWFLGYLKWGERLIFPILRQTTTEIPYQKWLRV